MPSLKSLLVGMVTAGAVVVGGGTAMAVLTGDPGPDRARVVKVIDGDTVDVDYDGSTHRVRLLNIDTPETKDPGGPVECLGPEATAYLEGLLEPGDVVRLEFDRERLDRYGRELAGVFEGDVLVNAELARAGMGVPVIVEPNRKFYPEVLAAYQEAQAAGVGLHSAAVDCTLASQVQGYAALVAALEGHDTSGEVVAAAGEAVEEGDRLLAAVAGAGAGSLAAGGLSADELGALQVEVAELRQRAVDAGRDAQDQIDRAVQEAKEAAERKAAEEKAEEEAAEKEAKENAEKKAREEAEAKAEEEAEKAAEEEAVRQAAEEQAAQEEAERRAAQPVIQPFVPQPAPQPPPAPAPQPPPVAPPPVAPPPVAPPPVAPPATTLPYPNCAAARAAGAAPVYIGTPGYGKHLDRDGDGIGCE